MQSKVLLNMVLAHVFVVLLLFATVVWPAQCPALSQEGLTDQQIGVLHKAFQAGQVRDMSYSLAAIAWKESSGGRYLVNLQDPSAGVFMVSIDNAISYIKWKNTPFNRNRVAQLLIEDFELAAEFAMLNLQFWKDQYGENWRLIWRRYNGGYSDSGASKAYSKDIARKVKTFTLCNWK